MPLNLCDIGGSVKVTSIKSHQYQQNSLRGRYVGCIAAKQHSHEILEILILSLGRINDP
jgi:hypothetical protein